MVGRQFSTGSCYNTTMKRSVEYKTSSTVLLLTPMPSQVLAQSYEPYQPPYVPQSRHPLPPIHFENTIAAESTYCQRNCGCRVTNYVLMKQHTDASSKESTRYDVRCKNKRDFPLRARCERKKSRLSKMSLILGSSLASRFVMGYGFSHLELTGQRQPDSEKLTRTDPPQQLFLKPKKFPILSPFSR